MRFWTNMTTGSRTRGRWVAWAAGMLVASMAGGAQAGLMYHLDARDLNGDGVTDAYYDRDLNITWLRDANLNGEMSWAQAKAWADGLVFGGYSDWRLPAVPTYCEGFGCTSSEMGHLWHVSLGNTASTANTGDFINLVTYPGYWTGNTIAGRWPGMDAAWQFLANGGYQRPYWSSIGEYAMAVRDGDVVTVPEPSPLLLTLAGLLGLAGARTVRRRAGR